MASEYSATERFILVAPETTEGTSPLIVIATHAVYVEEGELEVSREVLDRNGPSPQRPGWKPITGNKLVSFRLKTELNLADITGSSTVPPQTNILKAGGYKPTYSAAVTNNKRQTYGLMSRAWGQTAGAESSVTVNIPMFNDADTKGFTLKGHGCRGDSTLEMTGGERWFFTAEGSGSKGSKPAHSNSRSAYGLPEYDFSTQPTVVSGNGVQCQIIAETLTESPDFTTGLLRSLTIKANQGINVSKGVCGQRAKPNATAGTFECVIDMQDPDTFDPLQYMGMAEDGTVQTFGPYGLRFVIGVSSVEGVTFDPSTFVPSADCNYLVVVFTGHIKTAKMSDANGDATWTLSGNVSYDIGSGAFTGEKPTGDAVRMIWGTQVTP